MAEVFQPSSLFGAGDGPVTELLPSDSLVHFPPTASEVPGRWRLLSESGRSTARVVASWTGRRTLEIDNPGPGSTVVFWEVPDPEAHRSEIYELAVEVRCALPGGASISIQHQQGGDYWADRSAGGGAWERLALEGVVPHDATRLRGCISVAPGCRTEVRRASFRVRVMPTLPNPTLADLCEEMPDDSLPLLDRRVIDERRLDEHQRFWRENGYLSVNPYLQVPEIKDLCLHGPLMQVLESLIGEPMGMHLNLTGWVSTERDWHQDDYLNPPSVNNHYLAVWFALDDISPDAGPFEYIPGSHRWFALRRDRVLRYVEPAERTQDWTKLSRSRSSGVWFARRSHAARRSPGPSSPARATS